MELTENSDYDTIFLQTGLGRPAVDKLLADGNFQAILDAQDLFFNPPKGECTALLGWFTREDMLETAGDSWALSGGYSARGHPDHSIHPHNWMAPWSRGDSR